MTRPDPGDEHVPDGTSHDTSILGSFGHGTGDINGPGGGTFDDNDDEWLQEVTKRRLPRSTAVIGATLLTGLLLLGGMQIQKHYGATSAAAAALGGGTVPFGLPTGFPGAGAAAGAGATGGDSASNGTGSDPAAVIGTVVKVKGDTVIVKDIGGTKHTVTIPRSATIERRQNIKSTQLRAGESVTVNGQTRSDGHVDATSVTAR